VPIAADNALFTRHFPIQQNIFLCRHHSIRSKTCCDSQKRSIFDNTLKIFRLLAGIIAPLHCFGNDLTALFLNHFLLYF
jgi:hypothetical protein